MNEQKQELSISDKKRGIIYNSIHWGIMFVSRIFRKYYSTICPMLLISILYFFPQESRSALQYLGVWGMVAVFLLFIIRCFSLMGFSVLGGAASYLYGFRSGFMLFFFGSMTGTILHYYGVRKKRIKIPGSAVLQKAPSPRTVLGITLVRICPIFPYDLVTIRIAYDRKVNFARFFRGTVFGSFPWYIVISLMTAPEGSKELIAVSLIVGKILLAFSLLMLVVVVIALIMMG